MSLINYKQILLDHKTKSKFFWYGLSCSLKLHGSKVSSVQVRVSTKMIRIIQISDRERLKIYTRDDTTDVDIKRNRFMDTDTRIVFIGFLEF